MHEQTRLGEAAHVSASLTPSQDITWRCHTRVDKYHTGHWEAGLPPYETIAEDGNLLLIGGASLLWQYMIGSGTTASTAAKKYVNATGALGVGNSTTAAVKTQTALQGGSQALRAFSATYPQHTTSSASTSAQNVTLRSTFGTTSANFAWQEWGVFNKATTANRRMVNRKVQSLGTKSTGTWTLTVTLGLS